ncbi:MAG TPA: DUF2709 domain-containing protein [Nitrospirae bacterium]|nr:DUF2709 domain-containing protein [Nitrospirota bacterium]
MKLNTQDKIETLKKLLESVHCVSNIDETISAVLKNLFFCPFCDEYFADPDAFPDHIKKEHSNKLVTKTIKIETHEVDEDAESIYICPHCHFAVDNNCSSPTSGIIDHILTHTTSIDPTARISFQISSDKELIQKYISDKAEIKLFRCSVCTDIFGDRESLLRHLYFKHSDAGSKNTPYEVIKLKRLIL